MSASTKPWPSAVLLLSLSAPTYPSEVDSGGETGTVLDFLAERAGPKTQKQGGVNLTDICKIRFLMAGTQTPTSWQLLLAVAHQGENTGHRERRRLIFGL